MTEPEDRPAGAMRRGLTWFFAALGVLAALALILIAAAILPLLLPIGSREARAPVAAGQGKADARPYSVLGTDGVYGTHLVAIDIGYPGGDGYSKSIVADRRNVILLDRLTGASRRLLADNQRRVIDSRFLPAEADEEPQPTHDTARDEAVVTEVEASAQPAAKPRKPPPLAYYVLRVRKADGEREDLLVGSFATAAQAFVLGDIDGVDRFWMLAPTRLAVLFRKGLKLHYAVIDVPTLKVVLMRPVEIG